MTFDPATITSLLALVAAIGAAVVAIVKGKVQKESIIVDSAKDVVIIQRGVIDNLQERLTNLESHMETLEAERNRLRAENTNLRSEARRLQDRVAHLEAEVKRLGGNL